MDSADTFHRTDRRRMRLILMVTLTAVLVIVATILALRAQRTREADAQLQAVADALDESDSGWRWDEMLAARRTYAEDEDAARVVLAAAALLPRDPAAPQFRPAWPPPSRVGRLRPPAFGSAGLQSVRLLGGGGGTAAFLATQGEEAVSWDQVLGDAAPNRPLNPKLVGVLRSELARVATALDQARRLADLPGGGRYPINWEHNLLATEAHHLEELRVVATLLRWDAALAADSGDRAGALRAVRALLNAARSLGDEPLLLSLQVRNLILVQGVRSLERVLARHEATAEELLALEAWLDEEAARPALMLALRGERALTGEMLRRVADGELPPAALTTEGMPVGRGWLDRLLNDPARMRTAQRVYLLQATEAVRRAGLKPPTSLRRLAELDNQAAMMRRRPSELSFALGNLVSVHPLALGHYRAHVQVLAARTALAAERHRLRHGRWPDSLDALTPEFLPEVPADPFRPEPLSWRRTGDGGVVYSVGTNLVDDGGLIDLRESADLGFRLWDVAQRGR